MTTTPDSLTQCVTKYTLTPMSNRASALSPDLQQRLRAALDRDGVDALAARCECSTGALLRAAAGRPVHRATARVIEQTLAAAPVAEVQQ